MNDTILSDNQIKFILWLVLVTERSGLSCEACDGKFMIRHSSGLPLTEEVLRDVLGAVKDEADRLLIPIDIYSASGKIWLRLIDNKR
jgi:hypothetical protein